MKTNSQMLLVRRAELIRRLDRYAKQHRRKLAAQTWRSLHEATMTLLKREIRKERRP